MKNLFLLFLLSVLSFGIQAQSCAKTCKSKAEKTTSVESQASVTKVASVVMEKKECTSEELKNCTEACKKACKAKAKSADAIGKVSNDVTKVASVKIEKVSVEESANVKKCCENASSDEKKACCEDSKVKSQRLEREESEAKSCAKTCAKKAE